MTTYVIRRLLTMFVILFVISVLTFALMHAIPGGPWDRDKPLPAATVRLLNERYNLDAPITEQYLNYMGDIVLPRLTDNERPKSTVEDYLINIYIPVVDRTLRWMNFGPSYKARGRSVNDVFRQQFPVSAQLGLAALGVALAIGIPAGIIAALRHNSFFDYFSMGIAMIGVSVPVIVSGPLLRYLFGVQLKWLPPTGWGEVANIIMPAFALGFTSSALLARLTRASLLQVIYEDYIRTARAKGLSERVVIGFHAMKNAMIPVVTVIAPIFAGLVTGSFVAELVFGIPGLGKYFVTSITNRDYPVIMGTVLLYATIIILANLAVDIVYAWLDPRIQYS